MQEIKDLKSKLVIVTGFLVLWTLFDKIIFAQIALGLGLVFLISNLVSSWILIVWEKIGHILGWVNTRIILGIVFYIFLFPIATLFKLFNRDPLKIQWKKGSSAFTERNHLFVKDDLSNPW